MKKKPPSINIQGTAIVSTIFAILVGGLVSLYGEGDRLVAAVTVGLVWATLMLGLATLQLAQIAFEEIQESRAESILARDQSEKAIRIGREQHEETQRVAQRPLVIPTSKLVFSPSMDNVIDAVNVTISNVGPGLASNITAVYLLGAHETSKPMQFSRRFPFPLATSASESNLRVGGTMFSAQDKIGGQSLGPENLAPPGVSTRDLNLHDRTVYVIGRLTITYSDIFGEKHCTIYDYTHGSSWRRVDIVQGIPDDLDDLDAIKGQQYLKEHPSPPTNPISSLQVRP